MHIFYILEKLQLYNQYLVHENGNEFESNAEGYQIFGCVYTNTSNSQLNISLEIYLGNSLGNSIKMDTLQSAFVSRWFIGVVSCTSDIHSLYDPETQR